VLIVRAQAGFPAVGEVLAAFAVPPIVSGWMRGSHRFEDYSLCNKS
jgi:fructose 1,6-bisphosphate aldolase/phosphatase